jgi:NAD(P)H-hydrate epimerase
MAGSIALSSMAALRTGSGLVTAAVPNRCLETVASFHPGVMTIALPDEVDGVFSIEACGELISRLGPFDAIGCGPGMTTQPGSLRIVERLTQGSRQPMVLDADAINALALLAWPASTPVDASNVVLTPHPGELQRLCGATAKDRPGQIQAAAQLADLTGAIVVLKGGPTVVIGPGGQWTNDTGNPGMATAGSGDVLTGVITAFLGQQLSPWDAARLGVWTHGLAGDMAASRLGQAGLTCVDLVDALPQALAVLTNQQRG